MTKRKYTNLTKFERELFEIVLSEEIDLQSWFAMTYSNILGEEIFMCIQ